jgi:hypothetical protein
VLYIQGTSTYGASAGPLMTSSMAPADSCARGQKPAARPHLVIRSRAVEQNHRTCRLCKPAKIMMTAWNAALGLLALRELARTAASGRSDVLVRPAHRRRGHLLRNTASL